MCGLAGLLSLGATPSPIDRVLLERMGEALAHRGPDGSGSWVARDGRIGLTHRRLSIIDRSSSAAQPMANEDGSLQVVFNGEIYNHAELRRELERAGGHRWRTDHSDTEVLLHGYEEWGPGSLARLRGMFAIALWDGRAQELHLVRDRIGIKPLYYVMHEGRLAFASEIKALLEDPRLPREVDEEAFFHYLSFLTLPAPDTLFRGIRKLAPGTRLSVRADGRVREERYWDAWDEASPLVGRSDAQLSSALLEELRTSVRLRKVSDVPVGVFLSGGLDSTTNAALFAEGESRPVRTFSIGYAGEHASYPNELAYAALAAGHIGAEHHERILQEEELLAFLPRMVRMQDEPIADPVCFPVFAVAELARQHGVVVCQVGEGADELFFGYASWQTKARLQRLDRAPVPRALKRLGSRGLEALGRGETMEAEWLRRGACGQPVFWGGAEALGDAVKRRLLSPRLRQRFAGLTSWDAIAPIHARFLARAWDRSDLNWMTYLDLNFRLPELLLMRVDKMTMAVAVEGRVPFLDHRVVGLALSIPPAARMRGGAVKSILRRAVRDLVPAEVLARRKQGFGVPIREWFGTRLGAYARDVLDRFCRESDFLDPLAVRRLLAGPDRAGAWVLLNFALWWQEYVQAPRSRAASPRMLSPAS